MGVPAPGTIREGEEFDGSGGAVLVPDPDDHLVAVDAARGPGARPGQLVAPAHHSVAACGGCRGG
ncbi:hypothetical protein [Frankia sp. CcWB3]